MGKVYQRAVMRCPGIIFPTPYPQGYGATPPLPRPPQSACDVPGSMPEAAPYGNAGCVVHRACVSRKPHRVTGGRQAPSHTGAAESWLRALRTEEQHPGAPRHSNARKRRRSGVQLFTGAGRPRGVRHIRRPVRRYTHRPDTAIRPGACRPPRGLPDPRPAHPAAGAYGRRRTVGVVRRSNDGFRLAQPYIFSQLLTPAYSLGNWPINPLATRQEETRRYASIRPGRATNARRTSLHGF